MRGRWLFGQGANFSVKVLHEIIQNGDTLLEGFALVVGVVLASRVHGIGVCDNFKIATVLKRRGTSSFRAGARPCGLPSSGHPLLPLL